MDPICQTGKLVAGDRAEQPVVAEGLHPLGEPDGWVSERAVGGDGGGQGVDVVSALRAARVLHERPELALEVATGAGQPRDRIGRRGRDQGADGDPRGVGLERLDLGDELD